MAIFLQLLSAAVVLFSLAAPLRGLSRKYARGPVPLSEEAALHYSLNNAQGEISLALVITSKTLSETGEAWGGLGVSEPSSGSMIGADIASAVFSPGEMNNCTMTDRHVPFAAYPLNDDIGGADSVYPNRDRCQNDGSWNLVACSRDPKLGTLTIELRRALKAHDDQDRDISHGSQAIIYAHGNGGFQYHGGRRGSSRIVLFNEDGTIPTSTEDRPLPDDIVSNQTIVATGYTVPSDDTTTYSCTNVVLDIPPGGNLTLVAAEPILDSGSDPNMVHHLVVSSCPKTAAFLKFNQTRECLGDLGDMDCTGLVFAWAVGIGRMVLPDNVGFVLTEKDRYLSLNTHYDNPNRIKNTTDNSGVRLYFAKNRPIQAGTLRLGDPSVTLFNRTVKNDFKYQSTCPSECTQNFTEPINIFASFLHMHLTGREIYTNRLSKNGTFLNTINSISYWSNEHQMLRAFDPPHVMNPGEILSTTCIFDTRKRPDTVFGLATEDEMCMDFIFYYPLQKFRPSDGSGANCGMYQLGSKTENRKPSTICGPSSGKSLLAKLANPTVNDTKGVVNDFGNAPSVCTAAVGSDKPTSGSGAPSKNSTSSRATCFPASATVVLSSGVVTRMDKLQAGDRVMVGSGLYSDVFAFTHREQGVLSEFVTLHTSLGTLSLTPPHFLYADDALVPADDVRVGAVLKRADGLSARVVKVVRELKHGLYNPQTLHGDVTVDGFVTSTYTREVRPRAAHAMLTPLRFLARFLGLHVIAFEHGVSESNVAWQVVRESLRV